MTSLGKKKQSENFADLGVRTVSALAIVAISFTATWLGDRTFHYFAGLLAVFVLLEFASICAAQLPREIAGAAILFLVLSIFAYIAENGFAGAIVIALGVAVLSVWQGATNRMHWASTGLLYSAALFYALVILRDGDGYGFAAIVILFSAVWSSDTAAFFGGRIVGGAKLAPTISPNKTWSGAIAGVVGAMVITPLVCQIAGWSPHWLALAALGFLLSVVSQIGDIAESWLKRRFDVKDSGKIIPGHGGILDRIDGLIPAAAAMWLLGIFLANNESPAKAVLSAILSP